MAYCPNCNTTIAPDTESCARCGATFGPGSAWKPVERLAVSEPEYRPWKLSFLGLFLVADVIFVGVHQSLGALPLPSNYSLAQRVVTHAIVYSAQFLAAFVVGMILSLTYALITGQRGKSYRRATWIRALVIALLPAAILVYLAWWGVRHAQLM